MLLACYVTTLAPGVTFWDAGEFIAAAHVFGVPHPPGTPLYVALGRAWTLLLGDVIGVARAMNLLSAVATASAGALAARIVAQGGARRESAWGAVAGALLMLGPALLRLRFGVDEVVTTLLLNFVAILFVSMMIEGPLRDPLAFGWPQ